MDRAPGRTGIGLGWGEHACLVSERRAETLPTAAAFLAEGLGIGERALYVLGESGEDEVVEALRAEGVDVEAERAREALLILDPGSYGPPGAFEPLAMCARLRALVDRAVEARFVGLRLVAEMTWALRLGADPARLMEFEARANAQVFPGNRIAALCIYDREQFPASVLEHVLHTHPFVFLEGRAVPNPHYEPPSVYLADPRGARRPERLLAGVRRARAAEVARARRRLQERVRRVRAEAARRLAFLSEASRILAGSLDYERTLRTVAHLAIPTLADHCIVDVLEEDDVVERLEVGPAGEPDGGEARATLRLAPAAGADAVRRVLGGGESELLGSAAEWNSLGPPPPGSRVRRPDAIRSAMIVPMRARGRVLGAISFIACHPGRGYGPGDLTLAEELALRAALAVDNARLYREAEQSSRAKSEFLSMASHDFRTPISAILGYADVLATTLSGRLPAAQREQLEHLRMSAWHLQGMVDEMLAFARAEAGREEVQARPVDAGAIAREAAAVVRPRAREQGLAVELDIPEPAPTVETDPGKLRQILVNLLSNAVKFTPRGEVVLEVANSPDSVAFRIRDTGVGIEPAQIERIFEPFTRLPGHGAGREGLGLGLAIARKFARLLGGDIVVESQPGRGSTFTVLLPARRSVPA